MFFRKKPGKPLPPNQSKPMQAHPMEDPEPSYVGRDAVLEGQISCEGEIHVDGTIRGSLRARVCVIDLHGMIQGEVAGDIIHVRGRVIGPIQGSQVFIHGGAHVEGDVFHDTISIENGAFVYGTVRHNSAQIPQQSAFQQVSPPLPAPEDNTLATDTLPPLTEKEKLMNRLRLVQAKK